MSLSLESPLELTSVGPSVAPLGDKRVVDPEMAELQARTPEPAGRPNTASPALHTDRRPAAVAPTPTPVLEASTRDFSHSDSVPVRGDVLAPLQLPPLPTTRSKPSQLDISQGLEDGGQTASGRGESSGEGASFSPATPEPGLGIDKAQQPAVVFKEDVTPGTGLMFDKSPAVQESAKPPFHLIIVNVNDQNQSGERGGEGGRGGGLAGLLLPKPSASQQLLLLLFHLSDLTRTRSFHFCTQEKISQSFPTPHSHISSPLWANYFFFGRILRRQGPIGCGCGAIARYPDGKQRRLCTLCALTGPQIQTGGVFAEPDVERYEVNHHCLANCVELNVL